MCDPTKSEWGNGDAGAAVTDRGPGDDHYLKAELYNLVRTDSRLFEFLQAGSLDGVWYWDLVNPEQEWMSPRFWELFGYAPCEKEHLAAEWQEMIHPDDLTTANSNFKLHCDDPDHPYDQIVRYQHRDGSTVWVRCRGLVLRDEDGTPIRMLGAHSDLTPLKRVEEELSARTADLERSNEDLRQFASVAAHDLQSPIRTILGFIQLLERKYGEQLEPEALEFIQEALSAGQLLNTRVADLLAFARISTEEQTQVRVHLDDIMHEVRRCVEGGACERNAVTWSDLPVVLANRSQMVTVFQNLVENGLKYNTGDTPRVRVSAERDANCWIISVKDNGIGFHNQHADRIFEMFQRLHGPGEYDGTGIGLAMVKKIVGRHGGCVWAESTPRAGSTFFLSLRADARGVTHGLLPRED